MGLSLEEVQDYGPLVFLQEVILFSPFVEFVVRSFAHILFELLRSVGELSVRSGVPAQLHSEVTQSSPHLLKHRLVDLVEVFQRLFQGNSRLLRGKDFVGGRAPEDVRLVDGNVYGLRVAFLPSELVQCLLILLFQFKVRQISVTVQVVEDFSFDESLVFFLHLFMARRALRVLEQ